MPRSGSVEWGYAQINVAGALRQMLGSLRFWVACMLPFQLWTAACSAPRVFVLCVFACITFHTTLLATIFFVTSYFCTCIYRPTPCLTPPSFPPSYITPDSADTPLVGGLVSPLIICLLVMANFRLILK